MWSAARQQDSKRALERDTHSLPTRRGVRSLPKCTQLSRLSKRGPVGPPAQKVNATWRGRERHPPSPRDAEAATWTAPAARVAPSTPG